jgi:hypothetical protein
MWSAILWSTSAVQTAIWIEVLRDFGLPSDIWFQARLTAEYPVCLLDTPGVTFVRHLEQCSAGLKFSPEIMRDYFYLHHRIDALLNQRSLYEPQEHKRLMARFVERTCVCAHGWLQQWPLHHSTMRYICLALPQYERGFAPFCGWRPCPVLPHRARSLGDFWFRARSMAAWLSQRPRYARLADEQERDALSTVLARAPQ